MDEEVRVGNGPARRYLGKYPLRNAKRHGGHRLPHYSMSNILKKMTCSKTLDTDYETMNES
jgi:hypothetical protein